MRILELARNDLREVKYVEKMAKARNNLPSPYTLVINQ